MTTRRAAPAALLAGLATLSATGCVVQSEAADDTLQVVTTHPLTSGRMPAGDAIRITFDRYLDDRYDPTGRVTLASGDLTLGADVAHDLVGRALVVVPLADLRPGLAYVVTVDPDAVRGIDGATLDAPLVLTFAATTADGRWQPPPTPDFERDVAPIFARSCSCHGPEPAVYPPLTPESLVEAASHRLPGALLVRPGQPLRSLLVRKILPGYPGIPGDLMPPGGELSPEDRRMIVSWIEAL